MGSSDEVAGIAVPLLIVASVLAYAITARRLERVGITAAMVFVAIGVVLGESGTAIVPVDPDAPWLLSVAEITLALLLFSDAARLRLREVGGDPRPVGRLLFIGLPLTVVAGTLLAFAVFPSSGWAVAALIAALLAPTDAALGAAVVSDVRVPARVRRLLNVESGLNDGLATPVVTVLIAVVAAQAGLLGDESWEVRALWSLTIGVLVGVVVGGGGGVVLRSCRRRGWTSPLSEQVAALALALLSYLGATAVVANGFVAAFVGGMVMAAALGSEEAGADLEYTETSGLLASYVVWLAFGAAMVGPALSRATIGTVLIAVGALTVVRMVPVAIAMVGRGWSIPTIAFVGWFGPRGLATVIFALIALESLGASALSDHLLDIAAVTVLASILVHGFSAGPLAARYGRWAAGRSATSPELVEVAPAPRRRLDLHS
ncbi:cation:proton antiporter [Occultella gossypii]|uniref:Cation:proton antiporter n=1 Tax=Occultella gossypii TaxID=2800820 RepID=A0ABS7S684_9MICO|nr:cation:proton antiporter [Occultella gossypii]MBZ2195869.1 cation:proton antiporter [Occultella gossypii]